MGWISEFNMFENSVRDLIEFLEENWWHWSKDFWNEETRELELHTWGWSGNEELVKELENTFFWTVCWFKSERGGHYLFKIPEKYLER